MVLCIFILVTTPGDSTENKISTVSINNAIKTQSQIYSLKNSNVLFFWIILSLHYISVAIRHYRQNPEGLEDHREKTSFAGQWQENIKSIRSLWLRRGKWAYKVSVLVWVALSGFLICIQILLILSLTELLRHQYSHIYTNFLDFSYLNQIKTLHFLKLTQNCMLNYKIIYLDYM